MDRNKNDQTKKHILCGPTAHQILDNKPVTDQD